MREAMSGLWREESGQNLMEYGLLGGIIAVGAIGFLLNFTNTLNWAAYIMEMKAAPYWPQ